MYHEDDFDGATLQNVRPVWLHPSLTQAWVDLMQDWPGTAFTLGCKAASLWMSGARIGPALFFFRHGEYLGYDRLYGIPGDFLRNAVAALCRHGNWSELIFVSEASLELQRPVELPRHLEAQNPPGYSATLSRYSFPLDDSPFDPDRLFLMWEKRAAHIASPAERTVWEARITQSVRLLDDAAPPDVYHGIGAFRRLDSVIRPGTYGDVGTFGQMLAETLRGH